jgi:putative transposase
LGIKSLAMLSTGETVPNPRHLDRAQQALRRAHKTQQTGAELIVADRWFASSRGVVRGRARAASWAGAAAARTA